MPAAFHAAAAAWVAGMLLLARFAPALYDGALQEDRFVEWWTAALFGAAGVLRLAGAVQARRAFDLLVALFCIFVAGEEFSWGQRLLGYTPPDYFLAHNTQQEFTLHNFRDVFGSPKYVLILALAGYGLLLPAAQAWPPLRELLERAGASAPDRWLTPWFAAAMLLLIWYPVAFTGEWVEALAGALFLLATPRRARRTIAGAAAITIVAAIALLGVSDLTARSSPAMLACARAEAAALLSDVEASLAFDDELLHRSVHKRIQSAVQDYYLMPELARFRALECHAEGAGAAEQRRRFAIDPWGMAYWLRSEPDAAGTTITIYSYGPNRRRNSEPARPAGDDVLAIGRVRR